MSLAEKLEKLNALRPLSADAIASLSVAWDTNMIFESNCIEGNSLTLRETDMVLAKGVTVSGKPLKDHLEAVNLAEAWSFVKNLVTNKAHLTEMHVLELHRIVLDKVNNSCAGSYRTATVRISGASHIPPNHLKVPDLMTELFHKHPTIIDPLTQAATLHHGISHIHPFADGNGRTARLAMNFTLLAAGYPPISIAPDIRNHYYAALEAADNGNFPTFQSFLENQLHRELDTWLTALAA